jgi:hypothetical protein
MGRVKPIKKEPIKKVEAVPFPLRGNESHFPRPRRWINGQRMPTLVAIFATGWEF